MATLEVHDGERRVQFIELARDHPILFGTSAACDVILEGDGIRPVHGRIRWKKRRFRVEASPDAEFVLINGAKMSTGSIRQGDEIVVGVQWDVVGAIAFVSNFAIERVRRRGDRFVDVYGELQPDGEGDPENVEARTWSAGIVVREQTQSRGVRGN